MIPDLIYGSIVLLVVGAILYPEIASAVTRFKQKRKWSL
jgi:hypothetical protein